MRPRRHLVIMARAPRLGAVKRRLARDVGAVAAWRFYRLTLDATVRRLAGDPRWTTWLAMTPDRAHRCRLGLGSCLWRRPASPFPLPPRAGAEGRVRGAERATTIGARGGFGRVRVIRQGPGDLGARMERILVALPPGPAVIVGSDIPDLGAGHVARAFAALGTRDWVFGPASDGGYWLIGARRRRMPRGPFAGVRWSGPHALADTMANLEGARIATLDRLTDVDTGADLARVTSSGAP